MTRNFAVGWRQVGCCFALLMSSAIIATSYSVIAVPLGREFHPSRMVLMLAMTIMAGVSGLLSPFLGSIMDKASMRLMMLFGGLFLAAGYASLSLATSFNQVLIIFGLLIAPANVLAGPVASTVLISRWFSKRRGTAIGIAISGIAMSSVIFPPVVQGLLSYFDWRQAMQVLGVLLALITIPAALLVVDSPADRGLHPDGADHDPEKAHGAGPAPTVPVGQILGDPAFWMATAVFAVVLSGVKGMVTNLAPIAIDQGIKASDAAILISVYGSCGFISKLSFAVIADRFGPRAIMVGSLIGFGIGMALLTQAANGYAVIFAGVACVGFSGGIMVPLQSFLVPQIFGRHCVGRAMGLMSTVMLIALLSTPPLFGRIYDVTGSYTAIFATFIGLTALVALLVPYLRMKPRGGEVVVPPPAAEALI